LIKRTAFALLTGVLLFGCSNDNSATTDESARPDTISNEPSTVANPPAVPTNDPRPESNNDASAASTNDAPLESTNDAPPEPKEHEYDGPRSVLREGELTLDVMELVVPPRYTVLGLRLQQAARANPEWFQEQFRNAKPGEPLPYDRRMGMSEDEYREFRALRNKMTMRKEREAALVVATNENGAFVFDGGQALPDFTGIEIDLEQDVVRTPFGDLTERTAIDTSENTPLGAWSGTQWKLVEIDQNGVTGTMATLAVGRVKQSGRYVIHYDVKQNSLAGSTTIMHVLNYDLPPPE